MARLSAISVNHLARAAGREGAALRRLLPADPGRGALVDAEPVMAMLERLDDPDLPLRAAQIPPSDHQSPLTHLARVSPTLEHAIQQMMRYWPVITDLFDWRWADRALSPVGLPDRPGARAVAAYLVADLVISARTIMGPGWRPEALRAPEARGWDLLGVQASQRPGPIEIAVAAADLSRPLQTRSPALVGLLEPGVAAMRQRADPSAAAQVRAVLAGDLSGAPDLPGVARQIGMSRRTLHRKLAAEGTSFRALLDAARLEAARRLLADADRGVQQVAWSLGYSDARAFARAFRRWTGQTPSDWRREPRGAK